MSDLPPDAPRRCGTVTAPQTTTPRGKCVSPVDNVQGCCTKRGAPCTALPSCAASCGPQQSSTPTSAPRKPRSFTRPHDIVHLGDWAPRGRSCRSRDDRACRHRKGGPRGQTSQLADEPTSTTSGRRCPLLDGGSDVVGSVSQPVGPHEQDDAPDDRE